MLRSANVGADRFAHRVIHRGRKIQTRRTVQPTPRPAGKKPIHGFDRGAAESQIDLVQIGLDALWTRQRGLPSGLERTQNLIDPIRQRYRNRSFAGPDGLGPPEHQHRIATPHRQREHIRPDHAGRSGHDITGGVGGSRTIVGLGQHGRPMIRADPKNPAFLMGNVLVRRPAGEFKPQDRNNAQTVLNLSFVPRHPRPQIRPKSPSSSASATDRGYNNTGPSAFRLLRKSALWSILTAARRILIRPAMPTAMRPRP